MTKKTYLVFTIAAVVLLGFSWTLRNHVWASGITSNLFSGIIGILVTLLFVERILRAKEEESRNRVARGALRKTGDALTRMIRTFANILKGSLPEMPSPSPLGIAELFSDSAVEHLAACNIGSLAWTPAPRGWAEYVNNTLYESLNGLAICIGMYAAFLPAEYVETLDELHDHIYVAYVRSMYPYIEHERARDPNKEFPLDGGPDDRRAFFRTLRRAVEIHNKIAERPLTVPESFASTTHAPDVGSLRVGAPSPGMKIGNQSGAPNPSASNILPVPEIRILDL